MKKLKQLSKNSKPKVVFIYGPIASGKLTVANELGKRIDYKVFHNHMVIDLCLDLFGKEDERKAKFRENLYFLITNLLVKSKVSTVFTHAFATNFVFKNGPTDPQYVKETEKIVTKNGGLFYGVHLVCDDKELARRIKNKSRNEFSKLKDVKTLKELLNKYDHVTSAPIKNNLVINNTNLSAKKVADMIITHYKLK